MTSSVKSNHSLFRSARADRFGADSSLYRGRVSLRPYNQGAPGFSFHGLSLRNSWRRMQQIPFMLRRLRLCRQIFLYGAIRTRANYFLSKLSMLRLVWRYICQRCGKGSSSNGSVGTGCSVGACDGSFVLSRFLTLIPLSSFETIKTSP